MLSPTAGNDVTLWRGIYTLRTHGQVKLWNISKRIVWLICTRANRKVIQQTWSHWATHIHIVIVVVLRFCHLMNEDKGREHFRVEWLLGPSHSIVWSPNLMLLKMIPNCLSQQVIEAWESIWLLRGVLPRWIGAVCKDTANCSSKAACTGFCGMKRS